MFENIPVTPNSSWELKPITNLPHEGSLYKHCYLRRVCAPGSRVTCHLTDFNETLPV